MSITRLTTAALCAGLLAACGERAPEAAAPAAAPAPTPSLAAVPDEGQVVLEGVVAASAPGSFTLDYPDGRVMVEMDDLDIEAEGRPIQRGDRVTVRGRLDKDHAGARTIEARSVYVHGLNTFFYADDDDEEDVLYVTSPAPAPGAPTAPAASAGAGAANPGVIHASGKVTAVEGRDFTLDTGAVALKVDTSGLGYDPTDETGFQRIRPGDRVQVAGPVNSALLQDDTVEATIVITLAKAARAAAS